MATRVEIEAKHAGRTWTCAGPLALSQARRDLACKRYDEALTLAEQPPHDKVAAADALRALVAALHAYLVETRQVALSADEQAEVASSATNAGRLALLAVRLIRWRFGCGASTSAAIHALPYDGKEHTITCAVCGTQGKVTRPIPDEDRRSTEVTAGALLDEALGS